MGISDSPLRDRAVFVEGAARSGTSWLTVLLATHPEIAGIGSESHLFDIGVERLFVNHEKTEWFLGAYVTRAELADLVRDVCDGILLRMRERTKPEARLVVEKTPLLGPSRRVIERKLECYPDAWHLHIVRDGRSVTESLMRAPFLENPSKKQCARLWRESVEGIREAAADHPRYRELSYEELRSSPVKAMADVFRWLGVRADDTVLGRVADLSSRRYAKREPDPSRAKRRSPVVARLRGHRPGAAPSPPDPDAVLYRRLLVAAGEGDADAISELTAPEFALELQTPDRREHADGDRARRVLVEAVGPYFRRGAFVDVGWDLATGGPVSTARFTGVAPDGARRGLSLELSAHHGRVIRLRVVSEPEAARPTSA